MAMASSRPWSDLPEEILELVFESFTDFFDLLRCKSVCHSWRCSANNICRQNMTSPPLLFSSMNNTTCYGKLVLTTTQKNIAKSYPVRSPKTLLPTRCLCSYRGWLLMADINDPSNIHLYNLLSTLQFQLPPMPRTRYSSGPLRFTMTSSNTDECLVLVHYDHVGSLGYCVCALGEKNWRTVLSRMKNYQDTIFYEGEFYGVDNKGSLDQLLYNGRQNCCVVAEGLTKYREGTPWMYLVEMHSSGDLLMVVRYVVGALKTKYFEVFKLNWNEGVWEKVRSFGDEALLLAQGDSTFVRLDDTRNTYKRNCIYFVDDFWVGGRSTHSNDYGMYDLGSDKIDFFCHQYSPEIVNAASFYRWFRL